MNIIIDVFKRTFRFFDSLFGNMFKNLFGRAIFALLCSLILLSLTVFPPKSYTPLFIANMWIFGGLVISCLLTVFQVAHVILIFFRGEIDFTKITLPQAKKRRGNTGVIVFLCALAFVGVLVSSLVVLIYSDKKLGWLLPSLATLVAFTTWQMDKALAGLGCFAKIKNVLPIDVCHFGGLLFVLVAGIIIEKFTLFESNGFVAGATSFQIILASVLFDPKSLNVDEGCLMPTSATNGVVVNH